MSKEVAGNALWNIGGQLVSLGVGLVTLPLLLRELGVARVGIFTLALGLIGFSGLFDLGLGRALTQTVSSALGQGRPKTQLAALVWHVIVLLAWFGVFWMVTLWLAAPYIVEKMFSLTGATAIETTFGLRAIALSLPFVLAATGALGALEGLQQFRLLSLWRMPMTLLQFGLPLGVASVISNVGWVIAALAATRVLWMALWLFHLRRLLPREPGAVADRGDLSHAMHFGGWLSVSNFIGPIMIYADRFYLASVLPPAAVAHYTVPFDASYRATSLPQTAINAMFPALAQARSDPEASARMLELAIQVIALLAFPAMLAVAVLARVILVFWLGANFAESASGILRLLSLGIFLNCLAHLPYSLLQAHGRANLTAKLHLLELPVFALALVLGIHTLGIEGAALAWTLRTALDALLLYGWAWRLNQSLRAVLGRAIKLLMLAVGTFLLLVYFVSGVLQLALVTMLATACMAAMWYVARRIPPLTRKEKSQ